MSLSQGCGPAASPPPPSGAGGPAAADTEPAAFEEMTAASGILATYRNGEDTADHMSILESLGGGVGIIDYDGDGQPDVFFPGGGVFAGKDKKEITGNSCKLYRNAGGGRFRDVTAAAGLATLAGGKPWFYSHAVAVGDYDRDGWPDLLVTGWRAVALFRNVPVDPVDPGKGRRFEDVTAAAGLGTGITWATSAAFADFDGDGYPDLYVCQYVDWSWAKNPSCTYDGKTPDTCPPKNFDGLPHKVYRNTGRGTFVDASAEAGLKPGGPNESKGLGVVVVDVDGDGRPDVYVTNDTVDNYLYINQSVPGRIRFREEGLTAGVARDDQGRPNGSMGTDAGDPDRTGRPALWVTNYENELHALYGNESTPGRAFFTFRTSAAGIAALGQKHVGWGTGFLDYDLDGWEDLFVANGHAILRPVPGAAPRKQFPVLLHNQKGRFRIASRQVGDYGRQPHLARGLAIADLDNDGRPDVVISHVNEPAAILRGIGGVGRHWLGVDLRGRDHACVVGTRVVFEADGQRQTRFAKGGGSYGSSGDRRLLFGLGQTTSGRLTVTWPDRSEQTFDAVAADQYYRIVQGKSRPET
ncbi:hypothetical protein FRUB_05640 [Fimbriiglobus ruber]|uniref:ASPIC/UnbV domain-containing protein n=1 Tax=Fimbriiglobus ruber TaxID=1908690 RepID=A0A225DDX3_9BACT|nr:hypothetical protein FRUB_05640 [Fimbriiglobus ruber]